MRQARQVTGRDAPESSSLRRVSIRGSPRTSRAAAGRETREKEKNREEVAKPSAAPGDVSELAADTPSWGGGKAAFSYRGLLLRVHVHQGTPVPGPVHLPTGVAAQTPAICPAVRLLLGGRAGNRPLV